MRNYPSEYSALKADPDRTARFISSGKDGTRIFSVLNSNIKTLKTMGEYIDAMYPLTTYHTAYKQKSRRVKAFHFRSIDNHSDPRAITRSDIVLLAGKTFHGYDSCLVALLLYLLLLDTGNGKSPSARKTGQFWDSLPVFIKRTIYQSAREIVASDALLTDSIYQEIVVLYGDKALYQAFLRHIQEHYPDKSAITNLFVREAAKPDTPITQRLNNLQRSTLKKDALYAVIFYTLDQYVRRCKLAGLRSGRRVVRAEEFLLGFFDFFNGVFEGSLAWLGRTAGGGDIEMLKAFLLHGLSADQREELYRCVRSAFDLELPEQEE